MILSVYDFIAIGGEEGDDSLSRSLYALFNISMKGALSKMDVEKCIN